MDSLSDCSYKGKIILKDVYQKNVVIVLIVAAQVKGCGSYNIGFWLYIKTKYKCPGDKDSPVCPDNSDVTPAKFTNGCNGTKGIVFTNDIII